MALRADLAGVVFLLPADLNFATPSSVDQRYCDPRDSSITFAVWNMMTASRAGDKFLM
jgi:hypothetical protein